MRLHHEIRQLCICVSLLSCCLGVLAADEQQTTQIESTPQEPAQQRTDIVINSLDEGLVSKDEAGKRLRYDPSQQETLLTKPSKSVETTTGLALKPEPRNQNSEEQVAATDPVILDHRPTGSVEHPTGHHQTQVQSSTEAGPQQTTTQPPVSASTTPAASQLTVPTTTSQASQPQATPQPANWYPGNTPSYAPASPAQQQQRSNQPLAAPSYSQRMMASSSQMVGTVQHPTSINSIINDQQNQAAMQGQVQYSPAANSQQSQMVNMNGQPVYMASANGPFGGRRISISNWLRGISSMLANIFVRRDHAQMGSQPSASSTGLGHWVQFGPNAPHWLTQAQSAIQTGQQQLQQQQQYNMAGTNRYNAFAPAPQGYVPQQQQQLQQSQQPINLQPSTVLSGQTQQAPALGYQDTMMASASAPSYVSVQPPPMTSSLSQPHPVAPAQYQQPVAVSQAQAVRQIVAETSNHSTSSSQSNPTALNQSWSTQTNLPTGPAKLQTDQNLPLAHYSRHYGSNLD